MSLEMRNPLETLYNLIYGIINEIPDINIVRASSTNPKDKVWIWPNYPETNDENYPRVSITFEKMTPQPMGANRFWEDNIDENTNDVQSSTFGRYLDIQINIGVFIKKDQNHQITDYSGTQNYAKNQRQADYLADQISKKIEMNYDKFVTNYFTISGEVETTPAYDDNHFLFTAEIEFKLSTPDIWKVNYAQGSLIREISINETVTRTN